MKRRLIVLLPLLFWTGISGATRAEDAPKSSDSAPGIRVASVDLQVLFEQYPRTEDLKKESSELQGKVKKEDDERVAVLQDLEQTLQNLQKQFEDNTTSDAKKQALFKELQETQQKAMALDRERKEHLQRRARAVNEHMKLLVKEVLEEINTFVAEYAKQEGYDYVFDRSGISATQVPFLLYTKDSTDITSGVLKLITEKKPSAKSESK